jgi:Transposase domain (DUF772)
MTALVTAMKMRPLSSRRLPDPGPNLAAAGTGPRTLTRVVQAAAHALGGNQLKPAGLSRTRGCPPEMLLAVLSHCYALQIYRSVEIARMFRGDAQFRQLPGDPLPDVVTICRFRRENRDALHQCLTITLRFLADQKVSAGVVSKVNDAQLGEEASRRIIMATFSDSLELEASDGPEAAIDLCYLFAKPAVAEP